jgi:hypothetical protein
MILRKPARHATAVLAVAMITVVAHAQPTAAPRQSQVLRVSGGIVLAASIGQVLQLPQDWAQTTGGFASRVADQSGMFAIRTLAHRGLRRVVPWHADTAPCPKGRIAVARCALTQTLVVRAASGAPRPDLARLGSLALASSAPLLWRPDRLSSREAAVAVLTRVGGGLVVGAARRAFEARRR